MAAVPEDDALQRAMVELTGVADDTLRQAGGQRMPFMFAVALPDGEVRTFTNLPPEGLHEMIRQMADTPSGKRIVRPVTPRPA